MTGTEGGPAEDERGRDRPTGGDRGADRGEPPPAARGGAGPAGDPEPIDLDSVRDRAG